MEANEWIVNGEVGVSSKTIDLFPDDKSIIDNRPIKLLVQRSVALLIANEPKSGYVGRFSGGKDSVVIKELARMAGVSVKWEYSNTTIDPPELVLFIKRKHPDVIFKKNHKEHLITRAVNKKFLPTRMARWCCDHYKESKQPKGVSIILGVRIAESPRRKKNWPECKINMPAKRTAVLPIRRWPDSAVWEFIKKTGIEYCSLYDEGFKRLGCVMCPLASRKQKEIEALRWPKIAKLWEKGAMRIWEETKHIDRGSSINTFDDYWNWWLGN